MTYSRYADKINKHTSDLNNLITNISIIIFAYFYGKKTDVGGYAYFDKLSIEDVSICAYPMDIELVSVAQNSASIIWSVNKDGGSIPDHFRITVKDEVGAVVGVYDDYRFENDGSYLFTIDGLESSKNYTVVMRSDCEDISQGVSKYTEEFGAKVYKISRDKQGTRLTHLKITGGSLKVKELLKTDEKVDQIRIVPAAHDHKGGKHSN